MREWLVIENSWKNSAFAPDSAKEPNGYIPRDAAEKLLGRDLGGMVWFTREEGEQMRLHSEWRTTLPPNRTWWQQLLGLPTREVAEDVSALPRQPTSPFRGGGIKNPPTGFVGTGAAA